MLQEHLGYISDPVRIGQFWQAINSVVKRGDRVTDLGCGTGILGLLCLQAGAAHVCAIDDSPVIDIARESLARAGLGDRATFIRGRSQQAVLPERVEVVICDHVGYFGLDYGIVQLFQDARRRFLKPGGALIPARVTLEIAAVESEQCRKLVEGWQADDVPAEFRWLRHYSVNAKHAVNFRREDLLGMPAQLGAIDFREDQPEFFSWTVELRMERGGAVHGLGGWFDCELAEGVRITNSPLAEAPIRRAQVFLPISGSVQIKPGDRLKATVMARPADNLFAWTVEHPATGQRFSQSSWEGMLLSPGDLAKANPARVPRLNRDGLARSIVLAYCDGRRTVSEIEQEMLREHSDLFPSAAELSRFVAQALGRDTR